MILLSQILQYVALVLERLDGLELRLDGLSAECIASSDIHSLLVEDGYTVVVRTLRLGLRSELLYDIMDLCRGRILEDIEGPEAAVCWLQRILAHPASIGIEVEVVLRTYLAIHIREVDPRG